MEEPLTINRKIEIEYTSKSNILAYLCDKYGTDKGSLSNFEHPYPWPAHTYTDIYYLLFNSNRNNIERILECGIGTNNPNLPSSMGITGKSGASLRVWNDFFPNANIYGCDIDKSILFEENRIKTFYCDQRDKQTIENMINEMKKSCDKLDFNIIIDDGLHEFDAGVNFFESTIDYLRKDGIYIIEDVNDINMKKYEDYFKDKDFMVYRIKLYREFVPLMDNQIILITRVLY